MAESQQAMPSEQAANGIPMESMVVLGFETAALYWRAVHERRLPMPQPLELVALPTSCITTYQSLSQLDLSPLGVTLTRVGLSARCCIKMVRPRSTTPGESLATRQVVPSGLAIMPGQTAPIHLLTGLQRQRGSCACIKVHLCAGPLPSTSIYRIADKIAVTSPELTLVHLSRSQRMLPCLELTNEWCGSYALGPFALDCSFGLAPITDKHRLAACLHSKPAPRGSHSFAGLLSWTGEGLASPRETELYLMLVLPVRLGGFDFPRPYVNQEIPFKGTAFAGLSDHQFFTVDLFWFAMKLVVEYDGKDDHEKTPQQIASDKERRSVLAALGYTVIVVTRHDVESLASLERKVRQIALALGVGIEAAMEVTAERVSLFNWLFDSRHDHIPFGAGYR